MIPFNQNGWCPESPQSLAQVMCLGLVARLFGIRSSLWHGNGWGSLDPVVNDFCGSLRGWWYSSCVCIHFFFIHYVYLVFKINALLVYVLPTRIRVLTIRDHFHHIFSTASFAIGSTCSYLHHTSRISSLICSAICGSNQTMDTITTLACI